MDYWCNEELGAVAYDDEDGSLTDQIVISGSVNTNYPETTQYNTLLQIRRKFTVITER